MNKGFCLFICLSILVALSSCTKNIIDDTDGILEESEVSIDIDENFNGKVVSTSANECMIENGSVQMEAYSNKCVQTFAVNDGENVFLMARTPVRKNSTIKIDAQSTALALVTLYPLFSPVDADEYESLVSIVKSSEKFPDLCQEVSNLVANNKNIFDTDNDDLLKTFNNLIEDICADAEETVYGDTLVVIENQNMAMSKTTYESAKLNPTYINADITGNKLTLRTVGLTPTYFGTVTYAGGGTSNLALRGRHNFGGLDLFTRTVGNWQYGEPMEYRCNNEGKYFFNFSRMTPEATADFYMKIANCVLTSLGLELNESVELEVAASISRAMIEAGTGVNDRVFDIMEWIGIAYEATLKILKSGEILGYTISDSFINGAKFLSGSLFFYNKVKGIGNAATRLAYAISAPENFNFCLCCYDNQLTTCTEASILIMDGNNQKGYPGQNLLDPLRVYVSTVDEDGMYVESSKYHRVKYEVTKGGGKVASNLVNVDSDNTASVGWTLGNEGEQEVRAVVVDIITEKEISEPVYFTAELDQAEITVTLGWTMHSGNTDIDLHVIDPFGEEIYFAHMTSASGGFLDRDDRHGPGPEHIYWKQAPAGTYEIYVHYYPNEDEDKSSVSFTVTAVAGGVNYRPVKSTIHYDETVAVGKFTIGNESGSSHTLGVVDGNVHFIVPQKQP